MRAMILRAQNFAAAERSMDSAVGLCPAEPEIVITTKSGSPHVHAFGDWRLLK